MAIEKSGALKRARGRPRNFDRSIALHQAMKLFWERGYEGTSFDDLIAAMGISPSSFYNSFGNKERLYQEATEAYMARASEWFAGRAQGQHGCEDRLPPAPERGRTGVDPGRPADGLHDLASRHACSPGAHFPARHDGGVSLSGAGGDG